jgi:uncharacterized protein DUF6130
VLAHAGGAPEFASTALVGAGVVLAWIGVSRIRGRGFSPLPSWGAVAMLTVAPVALVGSVVVPSLVWPTPSGPRPSTDATIAFTEPAPEQIVEGSTLDVRVRVENARIVNTTTTTLSPDTGHIHVFLDGALLTMTSTQRERIDIGGLAPGVHRLQAEFVAADHAPFDPPVTTAVTFVKEAP